jgi:ubiquinone/menaquinone biosynthesis C-methylase UbiE
VGSGGKVISVDLQPQMLEVLSRRAEKAGVSGRITTVCCGQNDLGVKEKVDFALSFYMLHEVPDKERFFYQVAACLKPQARLLVVEPRFHVSRSGFKQTVETALEAGLVQAGNPRVRFSFTQLFAPL